MGDHSVEHLMQHVVWHKRNEDKPSGNSLILGVRKWICTSPRQGSDPKLVFESLYFHTSLCCLDTCLDMLSYFLC